VAIVLVGAVLVAALVALVVKWAPEWLATGHLSGKDEAEEVGRARTALLATLAGLIAIAGLVFTGLSYRLNRSGQITERFTRAVDQLGSKEVDIRLGGIYALERIARDSADDHPQVVEVLTAYVREHTGGDVAMRRGLPTDVQAAVTVLGRRDASQDASGTRLDLAHTNLSGANLVGANLQRALLSNADLDHGLLTETNLQDAVLIEASLEYALLVGANLQSADLSKADLQGATLDGANLHLGMLSQANLQGADLIHANLHYANLNGANLQGATLDGADLRGARYDSATTLPRPNFDREAEARGAVWDMP
jgi:hypothetical protein